MDSSFFDNSSSSNISSLTSISSDHSIKCTLDFILQYKEPHQMVSRHDLSISNYSFEEIGRGANTKIYQVVSKEQATVEKFAAKISSLSNCSANFNDLFKEAQIMKQLKHECGFPKFMDYAKKNDHEILMMSLLGPNLDTLHKRCNSRFSLKTICLLGMQTINVLEVFHKHGWVHRNINPENLSIGGEKTNSSVIYLLDFGVSKKYVDEKKKHIAFNKNNTIAGTLYYLSVFGHLGIETSRREDLISVCYMLIHLFKGGLPWIDVQGKIDERTQKIFQMKATIRDDVLCEGLPKEFLEFYRYVTTLPFYQKPDYSYIVGLFLKMLDSIGAKVDGMFDWVETNKQGIDLNARKIMVGGLQIYKKGVKTSEDFFEEFNL